MEHLDIAFDLHKDKAVSALKAASGLIILFFVTIVAVSTPLVYSISNCPQSNSADTVLNTPLLFKEFLIIVSIVFIVVYTFFHLKYDEYRYRYISTFIKMVLRNENILVEYPPKETGCDLDYNYVGEKVAYLMGENYNTIMRVLFTIIPPDSDEYKAPA